MSNIHNQHIVIIPTENGRFVGWPQQLEFIICQGDTEEEVIKRLKLMVKGAFEIIQESFDTGNLTIIREEINFKP